MFKKPNLLKNSFKTIDKKNQITVFHRYLIELQTTIIIAKMDNKTIKSKFNIRTLQNANALFCDDEPVLCIYKVQNMLPHPQIQGQAVIITPYCSDRCPMFNLTPGLFGKLKFECTKYEIEVYTLTPLHNV